MADPKLVCVVCGVTVREGEQPVSHDYCPDCAKKALAEVEEYISEVGRWCPLCKGVVDDGIHPDQKYCTSCSNAISGNPLRHDRPNLNYILAHLLKRVATLEEKLRDRT